MLEAQYLVMSVGGIDGPNDYSSLMANVLPRDTTAFTGTFMVSRTVRDICGCRLTRETPSVREDVLRLINVGHLDRMTCLAGKEAFYLCWIHLDTCILAVA